MQKQIGSILIVAGTCIGAGTLALPLALAPLGLIPGIITMIAIWALAYYTSLIHLELNLQAGTGLDLGQLAHRFSGRTAQFLSTLCLVLLMYALMTAYLYGGASVTHKLLTNFFALNVREIYVACSYALGITLVLLLPIRLIDYANRILLFTLFAAAGCLITGLIAITDFSQLPLFSPAFNLYKYAKAIPIIFTSFGFQVIFHTLVNYCTKDTRMLKQAFFWGSLIPTALYVIWSTTVLVSVHGNSPVFYHQLETSQVSVAELITQLSVIAHWSAIQLLAWVITLLAITTSALGVGAGLADSLASRYEAYGYNSPLFIATSVVIPAFLVALMIPNAFITVLGFAGMLLAFIALLIPIYLLYTVNVKKWHYPELRHPIAILFCALIGCFIIAAELYSILV